MFAVPLDHSILLDFLVGRKRGAPHASEAHAELHRVMALLNAQYRSKRFDFQGPGLIPTMFRQALGELPAFLAKLRDARVASMR